MEITPAIVVVAYNRIEPLQRLLTQIGQGIYASRDVTLVISIDYSDSNQDIVRYAREFEWEYGLKEVRTHDANLGLKKHILECGGLAEKYGAVIVLEDDLMIAPYFYEYARRAQNYYRNDERIAGVSLNTFEWNPYANKKFCPLKKNGDVYFSQIPVSWGQSWTAGQWREFAAWLERDGEIVRDGRMPQDIYTYRKSWGKYFGQYLVNTGRYYVMPYAALSTSAGETGVHSRMNSLEHIVGLYMGDAEYGFVPFEEGSHYDIFRESVDLRDWLADRLDTDKNKVCVDLYATKNRSYDGARYVLTTAGLDKEIAGGYSLLMRPHEMNVFLNLKGDDIFLYDMEKDAKNKRYRYKNRIMYDFAGQRPRKAFVYGIHKFLEEHKR